MQMEEAVEYIQQGITLMSHEKYDSAKEYFDKAVKLDPRNSEAYMHLGNACANLQQLDEAMAAFEKILILENNNGKALFNIGNIYLLKNNPVKCIEYYNRADENGFHESQMYFTLALIYKELKDYLQSIRNLTKAIRENPLRADVRIEKAKLYIFLNRFEEALSTLEDMQKMIPDAFEGYDLRAQIYSGLKQYDTAITVIVDGINRYPNDITLMLIKIKIYVEMKEINTAFMCIEQAREYTDYHLLEREILIQKATLFSLQQDVDSAIDCFEYILGLEKNGEIDEQARYLLMHLYLIKNEHEKCLALAKTLDSTGTDTIYSISGKYYAAYLLQKLNRPEEAMKKFKEVSTYLRKLSIKKPSFYEVYMYRLLCYKELGQYDNALRLADYMEDLYPERADAHAFRSTVYSAMGETDKADKERVLAKSMNAALNI